MIKQNPLGTIWNKTDAAEKEYINELLAHQRTLAFLMEKLEPLGVTHDAIEEWRMKETV